MLTKIGQQLDQTQPQHRSEDKAEPSPLGVAPRMQQNVELLNVQGSLLQDQPHRVRSPIQGLLDLGLRNNKQFGLWWCMGSTPRCKGACSLAKANRSAEDLRESELCLLPTLPPPSTHPLVMRALSLGQGPILGATLPSRFRF